MELHTKSDSVMCDYTLHLFLEAASAVHDNAGLGSRYRLIFVEKGSGTLTLNGSVVPFIAPSILCLNENDIINSFPDDGCGARTLYFLPAVINSRLTLEMINNIESEFTNTERTDLFCIKSFQTKHSELKVQQLGPNDEIRVKELFGHIRSILENPVHEFWPCLARSYFIELLNFIQRLKPVQSTPVLTGLDEQIKQIIGYLNLRYHEKITVADITGHFCIDRNTLSRRFLKATGKTLIEYLNSLRVNVSLLLLRDTVLPVNDIMYRVGFNDPAHFTRTFKAMTGTTPSEYRKSHSVFK